MALLELLPLGHCRFPRNLRTSIWRRAAQLQDPIDGCQSAAMGRSAFGKIYTYNLLPDVVAEQTTIKGFQRFLQRGVINACRAGIEDWSRLLTTGVRNMPARSFHGLIE